MFAFKNVAAGLKDLSNSVNRWYLLLVGKVKLHVKLTVVFQEYLITFQIAYVLCGKFAIFQWISTELI